MSELDKMIDEARRLRQTYSAGTERIRSNDRLTAGGRNAELAELRGDIKPKLDELRRKFWSTVESRIDELDRKLFTPPASLGADPIAVAASARDARDRVRQLNGAELIGVYGEATRAGDAILASAAASKAATMGALGPHHIVSEWASANGARQASLERSTNSARSNEIKFESAWNLRSDGDPTPSPQHAPQARYVRWDPASSLRHTPLVRGTSGWV